MTDASSEHAAEWAHIFRRSASTSVPADSTVVTTSPGGGATRSAGKAPPRKRSRASRRAPTTLLNTDTANFRAMVQQFTGVPTRPYGAEGFGFGFGFGSENPIGQPPAATPLQERQYYQYTPPQQPQQQDAMRMGYGLVGNGMDGGDGMPGFFLDGMGHAYTFHG